MSVEEEFQEVMATKEVDEACHEFAERFVVGFGLFRNFGYLFFKIGYRKGLEAAERSKAA